MSERITVSIELEFLNKYLFNALKRSLYNANPKRKLDIIYYYSRDPRVKFSISMTGYSTTKPNPSPQWATVFNNIQSMRQYLKQHRALPQLGPSDPCRPQLPYFVRLLVLESPIAVSVL